MTLNEQATANVLITPEQAKKYIFDAFIVNYDPADDDADTFLTSEDIKIQLREIVEIDIQDITQMMITKGFNCGKVDNKISWLMREKC